MSEEKDEACTWRAWVKKVVKRKGTSTPHALTQITEVAPQLYDLEAADNPVLSRALVRYFPTRHKFSFVVMVATGWLLFTTLLSLPWIADLSAYIPLPAAIFIVSAIALVPGYMNMFLVISLLLDRRPPYVPLQNYPPLSVLIAVYNEEKNISDTIESVIHQNYPGQLEILVIDDGSTDNTLAIVQALEYPQVKILSVAHGGKAGALNYGLAQAGHDVIMTIDADTLLFSNALQRLVSRLENDPPNTVAVAGAVLARNSRKNMITRMQEWDYFHGIAAIKRVQSLYQGTLVSQGAFSIYIKSAVQEVGGWPNTVGEDIVLTWALLKKGYRIGFAENAVAFTNVPDNYKTFYQQRRRWARGMIEAFKIHPGILLKLRPSTMFIYWNLLFPILDTVFFLVFIPGIIAALFGYYFIAGPMTLAVLPLALLVQMVMFRAQRVMFDEMNMKVRRNWLGFLGYILGYQIIMSPAVLAGYLAEIAGLRKAWGTK